jgi:membrane-associated phospholipid phosphatase
MKSMTGSQEPLDWKTLLLRSLYSADIYTLVMITLYSLLAVIYYQHIPMAATLLLVNTLILTVIVSSVLLTQLTEYRIFQFVRYFYTIPVVYLMYEQTHYFVRLVHPVDYDQVLIAADRWLLGTDPTVWFSVHSHPVLTEYLQICYFLFYVLPVTHAVELWMRKDISSLEVFARKMAFVYFVSYLAYFALPAVGPRFTLHDFASTSVELPGVWVTEALRAVVNAGGGITAGSVSPVDVVNRDCMPSGHTMLTLVNIILAFRFGSKFRWIFAVIGGSLIISTVYLRYHYLIDVVVGILLVVMLLPMEIPVDKYCRNYLNKR